MAARGLSAAELPAWLLSDWRCSRSPAAGCSTARAGPRRPGGCGEWPGLFPGLKPISWKRRRGALWSHSEPNVLAYALAAATAVFLVWWGIRNLAKPIVNYGMVAFALIVMWFYFASVMDKLDRSLGLIGLGILFLAGGWALEIYPPPDCRRHGDWSCGVKAIRAGADSLFRSACSRAERGG